MSDLPRVPDGRYALRGPKGIRFFKVNTPEQGRWAGFTFVEMQAGDNFHALRDRAKRAQVIEAISRDPHAALTRYGRELGVCGVCGRTLTDEVSREAGIGPICASRF